MFIRSLSVAGLLLLSGCTAMPPKPDFLPVKVNSAGTPLNARLASVSIRSVKRPQYAIGDNILVCITPLGYRSTLCNPKKPHEIKAIPPALLYMSIKVNMPPDMAVKEMLADRRETLVGRKVFLYPQKTITKEFGSVDVYRASRPNQEAWRKSLETALHGTGLFTESSDTNMVIDVVLWEFDEVPWGSKARTKLGASYSVKNIETGEIVYEQYVESEGLADMSDGIVGGVRGQIALNRSAQNNIRTFVNSLSESAGTSTFGDSPPDPRQVLHQVCDEHQKLVVGSKGRVYASVPQVCSNHASSGCRQYVSTVTTKPESQMSEHEIKTLRRDIASHCGNEFVACSLVMSRKSTCEEARKEFPW